MLSQETGWASHQIVQGVINLPQVRYADPAQSYAFYTRLEERLKALPGAKQVCVGWTLPVFQYLANRNFVIEGRDPPIPGQEPLAGVNSVTPSYLDTLKVKLLSGRNFSDADKLHSLPVALMTDRLSNVVPHSRVISRSSGVVSELPYTRWMKAGATREVAP